MNFFNKYFFSDFTLDNYLRLLKLLKERFIFIKFNDLNKIDNENNYVILRHDLEFSIPIALRMAKIEKELGITSTYFIQLHSEFYNPLDKESYQKINLIKELGHEIGLHFDAHFWDIKNEADLEKYIEIDKNTLEKYFNINIEAFSFHNTNEFILSLKKERYAGLINVYSTKIMNEFGYCTDSTGYWRYERLEDRILRGNDKRLHILIHDGMWQDEVLPPRRRVFKIIDDRSKYLKNLYDETLKKFGAKNIDWDSEL